MRWFNYHTHSTYCDGKASLSDIIAEAKKQNLSSLGFSSHAPLPFPCTWSMKPSSWQNYLAEINHLKSIHHDMELYAGLEVDFIPNVISPLDFQASLDYTIGSVHFGGYFPDGRGWEIDGPHLHFEEGLKTIYGDNFRKACEFYFENTRLMVQQATPTIVGHLDKIKMQNVNGKYFREEDSWYREAVALTLSAIQKSGCLVEVNTRGIYQKKTTTTYPSPWILERMKALNIPVTVSSDAHHPDDLINQFPSALAQLLKIGYQEIYVLEQGHWVAKKIISFLS